MLVRPGLLAQLDVGVGDEVGVGNETLTIRDVIISEPGAGLSAFSFGPRVIVDERRPNGDLVLLWTEG